MPIRSGKNRIRRFWKCARIVIAAIPCRIPRVTGPRNELEKYRLDDPITRLRAQLTREGKLTNEQFDQLDKQAKETVLASVKFAEESPEPPLEKLYDYTYVERSEVRERNHLSPGVERSAR